MIEIGVSGIQGDSLVSRRGFLRVSMAAGGAMAWANLPRAMAEAGQHQDTAVIQIWLGGGPSQYETYDMKPDAPVEVRGEFKPIATKIPGLDICELLPKQAQWMDRLSVIRSLTHDTNDHHAAQHWMQSGHYGPPSKENPEQTRPAIGSVVAAARGAVSRGMVSNVHIAADALTEQTLLLNFGPAYLGSQYQPLRIKPERVSYELDRENYFNHLVSRPNFSKPIIELLPDISVRRLDDRRHLLATIDELQRGADQSVGAMDEFRQQAFELVANRKARHAFDLSRESNVVRDRFGRNVWGQAALMARRLVEAGVSFVTVNTDSYALAWDSHYDLAKEFRKMLPVYDQMLSALIADLVVRGLYDRVVLLVVGEFGRTSRIDRRAGRGHWGKSGVALIGGGGLRTGCIVGASDRQGAFPIDRPVSPGDLLATVYHSLGVDTKRMFHDPTGRPLPILSEGEPIAELI